MSILDNVNTSHVVSSDSVLDRIKKYHKIWYFSFFCSKIMIGGHMKIDLDKIKDIYGESSLYEIKDHIEEITNNMNYLIKLGFSDVYDILETNPYMFLYDTSVFKDKVDKLISKLGIEYIEKLEEDFSLWGEIDD